MKAQHFSMDDLRNSQRLDSFRDTICDPYQLRENLPDPSFCQDCGAVYHQKRWQWTSPPSEAFPTICPACGRMRDGSPAGYVSIEGRFAREYRNELQLVIQNTERRAKSENPMQRIMSFEEQPAGLVVATTDIRLACEIGEALHEAYNGNLDFHYNESEYLLCVHWQRWS